MLKSHFTYLKGAVGIAIESRQSETIIAAVERRRMPNRAICGLIKDIVSDARFYFATDTQDFWKLYSADKIRAFIDSIDATLWSDEEKLTLLKEDFLNRWLAGHMAPLTDEERERKRKETLISLLKSGLIDQNKIDCLAGDGDGLPFGIIDMTNAEVGAEDGMLPQEIEELVQTHKNAGPGAASPSVAKAEYLRRIDPQLRKLASAIGRSDSMDSTPSRFGHGRRSDISGITVGEDLNSLLPSELALLAANETQDIFLRNYTCKRLQIFSSASQTPQKNKAGKGPIIMCIDSSSSMAGSPEKMAKTLAMAIAIVAQRGHRPLFIVNYSYKVAFFALTNLATQWERFLSFLSLSYGGGNDENMLFNFLFAQLPASRLYKRHLMDFKGADLLLISDFIWRPVTDTAAEMIAQARSGGMRIFSLEVGNRKFTPKEWSEMPQNGEWFLQSSDHLYVYDNGILTRKK